jgi:hypothetical protein
MSSLFRIAQSLKNIAGQRERNSLAAGLILEVSPIIRSATACVYAMASLSLFLPPSVGQRLGGT